MRTRPVCISVCGFVLALGRGCISAPAFPCLIVRAQFARALLRGNTGTKNDAGSENHSPHYLRVGTHNTILQGCVWFNKQPGVGNLIDCTSTHAQAVSILSDKSFL